MKPLQHAQISQKTHGGKWQDYIAVHSFLDSSKAACAHFKHRFLLHHREGIELGARIFGEFDSERQRSGDFKEESFDQAFNRRWLAEISGCHPSTTDLQRR